jgi:peroxiredoxin
VLDDIVRPVGKLRLAWCGFLVVALAVAMTACSSSHHADNFIIPNGSHRAVPSSKRLAAPAIHGTTMQGNPITVSDYRGRVVLLNFFGSWCGPCRVESPDLERVYQQYEHRGLAVIGVDVRETQGKGTARGFIKGKSLTYPIVWDPDSRIALAFRRFPPSTVPATVVIDRTGRIAGAYLRPLLGSDFTDIVGPLVAEGH